MEESLSANSVMVQDYMAQQSRSPGGMAAALQSLGGTIQIQALTMTYIDLFWILTIGVICVSPLILLLRPLPQGGKPVAAH